jgi:phosphoribosylanthranilate isomerase
MRVKICGMTSYEDARAALELGAGLIGFVLAPSPRRMEVREVGRIVSRLRDEGRLDGRKAVGVFVNESPAAMERAMAQARLDEAQIHGDESPAGCAELPFPWYRALRIGSASDAEEKLSAGWSCRRLLVDALSASGYGGTGTAVEASSALAAKGAARRAGKEFFLAGGISPHNVAEVLRSVSPDGIDLCSGVEERPGSKSLAKLERLFEEIDRAMKEMKRAGE